MAAVALLQRPNYPTRFRGGIIRAIQYVLTRIEQAKTGLVPKDRDHALHTLSYALAYDDAWPIARKLLLTIAPKMEQAGHRDDWMVYLERGIEQSQKLGDVEAEAELRFHLGLLYQYLSELAAARHEFELSAQLFSQLANPQHQARALNRLAVIARRQRHFEKATRLVNVALELLAIDAKEELGYSYLGLGTVAFDQRAWSKAERFFSKSLAYWEEIDNQRLIAWGMTNLGPVFRALGRDDEAIASYKKAIELFEVIGDPVHQATAKMNLGNVYLKLEHPSKALDLYLEAEPIFRQTQERRCLAMINNNKGMAYHNLQQWGKAITAYQMSIQLLQQIGHIRGVVNVMDNLGMVYLEKEQYDKAISTFVNALDKLDQTNKISPRDNLFMMVTAHLHEAQAHKK